MGQYAVKGRACARLMRAAALALGLLGTGLTGIAWAAQDPGASATWVGTWGTAPAPAPQNEQLQTFRDQTLRLIVHTSVGGSRVRIRLSNEFGATPLRLGAVRVGLRKAGAEVVAGSERGVTFGGQGAVTLAPGAPALSDPIELAVPAMADLAVSLYLPDQVQAQTVHSAAFQTSYVSTAGDHTAKASLPVERSIQSWPFLTEVDVDGGPARAALVTFGDSITDGSTTTKDTNRRWPDVFAMRLLGRPGDHGAAGAVGVVNRGIGGNRLLRDPASWPPFGKAALARFDRDVLATAGVKYLVVLIGINDIGHPGAGAPASETVTAQELIAGYRQLIARAHDKGVKVFGATLTPFKGTTFANYYSAAKDAVREEVNRWIRTGGEFDGVIDFDLAVRDPAQPSQMLAAYDSGDHLHPNDQGMRAMAQAVPLELFQAARQEQRAKAPSGATRARPQAPAARGKAQGATAATPAS
ncbi:MAG: SGNH/GDSL hydrolase family protein [Gammaproteobacteria bacterium]